MGKLLVLARGEPATYQMLDGTSVFAGLPVPLIIFTDQKSAERYAPLRDEGAAEIEVVRWGMLADVAARVRARHAAEPLMGLACVDEMAMDMAGALRGELGLPGLDAALTARFRDKRLMKTMLGAAGVRVPEFATCDDRARVEALFARHGKLALKPFDGLGSKSVSFVDNAAALAAWYDACVAPAKFQAEEYVEGTLYHVNAVVIDGRSRLTVSAPYLPGMANIDFASGAPFVSRVLQPSALKDRLQEFSDRVIAALGLPHGVTHLECFVTAADEIVFCEIGARPGGGGIIWMMEAATGVNYARAAMLLEAGRGDLIRLPANDVSGPVAGLMGFRYPDNAFVRGIAGESAFADAEVLRYTSNYRPGDFVPACGHCTDYVGLLIFRSRNDDHFEQRRRELFDRFYSALHVEAA